MKILIELPDDWLDASNLDNLTWMTQTVRQEVRQQLVDAIVNQVTIPQITITAEELKPLVLNKIAENKAAVYSMGSKWYDRA